MARDGDCAPRSAIRIAFVPSFWSGYAGRSNGTVAATEERGIPLPKNEAYLTITLTEERRIPYHNAYAPTRIPLGQAGMPSARMQIQPVWLETKDQNFSAAGLWLE
jgi:hypothetical protein